MWSRCPGSNRRPRPYQGRALPTELHRPSLTARCARSYGRQVGPTSPITRTGHNSIRVSGLPSEAASAASVRRRMERETGIEPATNSLEGCDSTTELLPPPRTAHSVRRFGGQARHVPRLGASAGKPANLPLSSASYCFNFPWLANRSSEAARAGDERRLVAREGFEPSKPLGRQIYSLLRLTASLPRQKSMYPRSPPTTLPCPAPRLLEPPDPTAISLND